MSRTEVLTTRRRQHRDIQIIAVIGGVLYVTRAFSVNIRPFVGFSEQFYLKIRIASSASGKFS